MKGFARLFANIKSCMTRGVKILKTKGRKHKPGFKLAKQWAWWKVIWMICNSSLVKCIDKWWTRLFQFRIPHILNCFILKCFVKWLVYWKSLLISKVRSKGNHFNYKLNFFFLNWSKISPQMRHKHISETCVTGTVERRKKSRKSRFLGQVAIML